MADASVNLQANDLFNLGSSFEAQSSSTVVQDTVSRIRDSQGGFITVANNGVNNTNTVTRYTANYVYSGTDLDGDFTAKVGQVVNSIMVDSITVTMEAEQPVKIDMTGHNHSANAHIAATTGLFDGFNCNLTNLAGAAVTGWDCPALSSTIGIDSGSDSAITKIVLAYTAEHEDLVDKDGDHHVGTTFGGICNISLSFVGIPSFAAGATMAENTDSDLKEANQSHDTTDIALSVELARTTAA